LNDDDALELFKKTLPGSSASLLQVSVGSIAMAAKALNVLRTLRKGNDRPVDFLEVALRGGTAGFEKIIKLIDELVAQLHKEQTEDDAKKDYCDNEFDKPEDMVNVLANEASDLETALFEKIIKLIDELVVKLQKKNTRRMMPSRTTVTMSLTSLKIWPKCWPLRLLILRVSWV